MSKVIIVTKAEIFKQEEFVDVFISATVAEKWLRKNGYPSLQKDGADSYSAKVNGKITLFFIRNSEVKEK